MKRRDFITKGSIVGAGVVGVAALSGCEDKKEVAAPAVVADKVEIAMVSTWPRDFPGLGTAHNALHNDFQMCLTAVFRSLTMQLGNALVRLTLLTKWPRATLKLIMPLITTGKASIRDGLILQQCRSV